jgi:hypothetical protein
MTFLSFSLTFDLLDVLHVVFDSKFKLYAFCVVNVLIKGEIEKPSGQYHGLICDEKLNCLSLNLNLENFDSFTLLCILCGEMRLLVS